LRQSKFNPVAQNRTPGLVLTDAIRLELNGEGWSWNAPTTNPQTTQGGLAPPARNPILESLLTRSAMAS
jgi:hypothetical protein